uniref:Uncharacterized protein n=1 Tax=viral metagenome TaxID=1070528 RepID=A0A6H1ZQF4_9ZZZZ
MDEDFDIIALTERDLFVPLLYGSRGVKWLHFDDVIDSQNLLMFTCAHCRLSSSSVDEKRHEAKCKVELMNKLGM